MNNFFERMENIFKEALNHPVPALLYDENKKLLTELQKGKGKYDFKKDFIAGTQAEELVKNFLIAQGYKYKSTNNTIEYDLLMSLNDKDFKFEIKSDFMAESTGNIAIEEECRGKESGIQVWNCDYVVYLIPQKSVIGFIKLDTLRTLVSELKRKRIGRTHKVGGDEGSNTVNYLMPYHLFEKNFKIVPV